MDKGMKAANEQDIRFDMIDPLTQEEILQLGEETRRMRMETQSMTQEIAAITAI